MPWQATAAAAVLKRACAEVMDNDEFARVLEIVLALGNFLNGTSFRGQAYGFKLAVLTKLADTKCVVSRRS